MPASWRVSLAAAQPAFSTPSSAQPPASEPIKTIASRRKGRKAKKPVSPPLASLPSSTSSVRELDSPSPAFGAESEAERGGDSRLRPPAVRASKGERSPRVHLPEGRRAGAPPELRKGLWEGGRGRDAGFPLVAVQSALPTPHASSPSSLPTPPTRSRGMWVSNPGSCVRNRMGSGGVAAVAAAAASSPLEREKLQLAWYSVYTSGESNLLLLGADDSRPQNGLPESKVGRAEKKERSGGDG